MAETFYRNTTNGVNVGVGADCVSLSQTARVRDDRFGHLPFVNVSMFMEPSEARELAALLVAAADFMEAK